jgi:hypothetical protein
MDQIPRHQCLIYDGSPSRQLPALALAMKQKLGENYRCVFLNSPPMVAGMRSYLAAAGVDIAQETDRGSLILSSDRDHLENGHFDPDRMMAILGDALAQARRAGYQGLGATGDMTWEFGPENNFAKLFEYECLLEDFFRSHPALSGVCQYHADTLPPDALRQGLASHPAFFVNETLARINPHYLPRAAAAAGMPLSAAALDRALERLLAPPGRHTD